MRTKKLRMPLAAEDDIDGASQIQSSTIVKGSDVGEPNTKKLNVAHMPRPSVKILATRK